MSTVPKSARAFETQTFRSTRPNARTVKGFPPVMPEGYGKFLKADEVAALVAYLESL